MRPVRLFMKIMNNKMKLMKRYFLTFCTLALGMLTSLWVCAQSEITASEKTEKTPGEQLIEFVLNPPEKFDFAGMQVTYFSARAITNYFRLKRDNTLLFNAIGDEFIVNDNPICDLKHYGTLFSRYRDEYWDFKPNQLTTWTNHHLKEENKINQMIMLRDNAEKYISEMISLFHTSPKNITTLENKNTISHKDGDGNCLSKETLIYNDQGYLIQDKIIYTTPIKLSPKTGEKYTLGFIREYCYETNRVPLFFPSQLHGFRITKTINNGEESIETNKYYSYFYDHLDLSPSFNKANFEVIPKKEDNLKYYWISGTNTVYEDKASGTIQKVLSEEDVDEYLRSRKKTQSKYRGIYIVLVIISFMVFFFLIMKKSKSK